MTHTAQGRSPDVVELLTADHRSLEEMLAEFEAGQLSAAQRGRLLEVLVAELVRHSVAEEEYLYPAAREALPDGDRIADRGLLAHTEAETVMKQLAEAPPDTPAFDQLAARLVAEARAHIQVEEGQLFPRLRAECEPGELRRLAVLVGMAKDSAPTRPHPGAPHRPPWNLFLAPTTGIVDQIRDSLRHRPTHRADLDDHADEEDGRAG